jgi:TPR repeat protein
MRPDSTTSRRPAPSGSGRSPRPSGTRPWLPGLWIGALALSAVGLGFLLGSLTGAGGGLFADGGPPSQVLQDQWRGIDLAAAHPDDPDRPADVPGATDADIEELTDEEVSLLLDPATIDSAVLSADPRHVFALGRVALLHNRHDLAFDLLLDAAQSGSVPARLYLAVYLDDDPDMARSLIQEAADMGFAPAMAIIDELRQGGAVESP